VVILGDYTLKWLQAYRTIHLIRNTAEEEDGKEEPDQDIERLPEDRSADNDEEEGDERLDQNTSN
jgi:hypothetical protein